MTLAHAAMVLHVVGVALWIGGTAASALAVGATDDAGRPAAAASARAALLRLATPGMVLAWLGGLTMLTLGWDGFGASPWMHAKLTLAVVATGVSGVITGRVRRLAAAGEAAPAGPLTALSWSLVAIAALVAVLAVGKSALL